LCTSSSQSAILNSASRLTSDNVGRIIIGLGMVKNMGKAVGISAICHVLHAELNCTSGLHSAILNFASRPTSGNVGSITIGSGMVENAGKAVGISAICHSIPEFHSNSLYFRL
jgi:hypothetical protein